MHNDKRPCSNWYTKRPLKRVRAFRKILPSPTSSVPRLLWDNVVSLWYLCCRLLILCVYLNGLVCSVLIILRSPHSLCGLLPDHYCRATNHRFLNGFIFSPIFIAICYQDTFYVRLGPLFPHAPTHIYPQAQQQPLFYPSQPRVDIPQPASGVIMHLICLYQQIGYAGQFRAWVDIYGRH